jgi:transcriptional regulator with XRE-family HTH domain
MSTQSTMLRAIATGDAPAPLHLRSEGQRMLLHVTGSLQAIAAEVSPNTSKQSVLDWRNGVRKPGPQARARIYAAFGIPPDAWMRRAVMDDVLPPQPAAEPDASLPAHIGGTTLEDCLQLLAIIKRDRMSPGVLPSERVKLVDAEARILKLRSELESRTELSEDRYVREHPAWLRARNIISAALKDHPAAARAVADALERSGL